MPVYVPEVEHGEEPAPASLRAIDRPVLSLLHRILARVLPESSDEVDGDLEHQLEQAEILKAGFAGEYWREVAGFRTELSKRDCRRVSDILQMFRTVTYSIDRLQRDGTPVDEKLAFGLEFRGMDGDPFVSALAADWALARYYQNLAWAVEQCLSGIDSGADPLFQRVVSNTSGRRQLSFVAAFDVRDQLIATCPGRFERARAKTLIESIGSADAASRLIASLGAEADLLKGRWSRCRNALMHGNPVGLESVRSVRPFSQFIVRAGLDGSIRSITESRPVADLLDASDRTRRAELDELRNGKPFSDIWRNASAGTAV